MKRKMYIVVGPTASGKTAYSIDLARFVGGEIINADSIQVYRDVPLLTARPTIKEENLVPHHLFGFLDDKAKGSVTDWLERVHQTVEQIETPVFVGGTGFYIKALTEGLSPIPDISESVREQVRQTSYDDLQEMVPQALYTDPHRLMRAAEVFLQTGKHLSEWQQEPRVGALEGDFRIILIMPERGKLYTQCNYRFEKMVEQGALRQVVDLLEKNKERSGGVFQAIGVAEFSAFLEGKTTLDEAIELAKQHTRNYAKRQKTWFSHQIKADLTLQTNLFDGKMVIKLG